MAARRPGTGGGAGSDSEQARQGRQLGLHCIGPGWARGPGMASDSDGRRRRRRADGAETGEFRFDRGGAARSRVPRGAESRDSCGRRATAVASNCVHRDRRRQWQCGPVPLTVTVAPPLQQAVFAPAVALLGIHVGTGSAIRATHCRGSAGGHRTNFMRRVYANYGLLSRWCETRQTIRLQMRNSRLARPQRRASRNAGAAGQDCAGPGKRCDAVILVILISTFLWAPFAPASATV